LYAASHAAQFAIEAHPKYVKEQEFAEIVNVYSSRVKELRVRLILSHPISIF
jgi:hypothetical protein